MSKFKVYLAGAMSGLTLEEMDVWRVKAKLQFDKKVGSRVHTINPVQFYNFEIERGTYTEREVKEFDLNMVQLSDLILVNLEHPKSIGTAIELHMAHDVWHKPVIAFGVTDECHPWIKESLTKECATLEEAVDYILDFYFINH